MLCRNYKNFRNEAFREELDNKLFKHYIYSMLYGIATNFEYIFQGYLQRKNWDFEKSCFRKLLCQPLDANQNNLFCDLYDKKMSDNIYTEKSH